jgi:hypothetical protein
MNDQGRRECGPDCDALQDRVMAMVARHFGDLGPALLATYAHVLDDHDLPSSRPECGVNILIQEWAEGKR